MGTEINRTPSMNVTAYELAWIERLTCRFGVRCSNNYVTKTTTSLIQIIVIRILSQLWDHDYITTTSTHIIKSTRDLEVDTT